MPEIIPSSIYIERALQTPYLMHCILSVSALQQGIEHPESREFYYEYSIGLRERSLLLFSESHPALEVNRENCVQLFLFSTLVGVQLLTDTLYFARDSIGHFVSSFAHCLSASRGVLAIMEPCRSLLDQTELEPYLSATAVLLEPPEPTGPECQPLMSFLDAANLPDLSKNAYREATRHLQQAFNARRLPSLSKAQAPMVLVWPVLVSPTYVDLLRRQEPEALAILAHYAVLLHRARDIWIIGDGGRFLIESISESLGHEWEEWLKFPKLSLQE
jgi:hypothetical protein